MASHWVPSNGRSFLLQSLTQQEEERVLPECGKSQNPRSNAVQPLPELWGGREKARRINNPDVLLSHPFRFMLQPANPLSAPATAGPNYSWGQSSPVLWFTERHSARHRKMKNGMGVGRQKQNTQYLSRPSKYTQWFTQQTSSVHHGQCVCTRVVVASFSVVDPSRRPPQHPSLVEWISKLCCIHSHKGSLQRWTELTITGQNGKDEFQKPNAEQKKREPYG